MSLGAVTFPTLGWGVLQWMEGMLVHGPGDVQGRRLAVDDELARFIAWCYRIHPSDHPLAGRRVYRRAVLSRPKGRAKSELAGALVCAEALGPVRFDGWDASGDPVGRPVTVPMIRCLATEEDQSGHTYDAVRVMLAHCADQFPGLDVGMTRVLLPGGGEIIPSTASSAAKEGGRETFAVADETHLYVLPELRRMHATVRRNLGKRKAAEPWMLDTTTGYLPGEESIAEDTHRHVEKVGVEAAALEGLLVDHREAPEVADLHDDEALRAALADVYGPAGDWLDLERIAAEVRDPAADPAESRRYWLNQIVASSEMWLSAELWDALRDDAPAPLKPRDRVALGFDGSAFDDSTALVAVRLEDHRVFLLGLWEKPEGPTGRGWEVPRDQVDAAVRDAFERLSVALLYADPPYWQAELARWHASWPESVYAWYTNRDGQMAEAVELVETAVRSGSFSHNGDLRLRRHVLNTHKRSVRTRGGDTKHVLRKERRGSPRKIDAAVAMVLALAAAADAVKRGLDRPPRSRVLVQH